MWKKLSALWALLRGDLRLVRMAWKHPHTPRWFKLGVLGLAAYLISPIDLIPDALIGLGQLDDLVLIPFALRMLLARLPAGILPASAANRSGKAARSGSADSRVIDMPGK